MERRIRPQGDVSRVLSKNQIIRTLIVVSIARRTTYGASTGKPSKEPTISDGPFSHQVSIGREYCDIPIADVTVPARNKGSA